MKKSINNPSFDEIFAERGKEVKISKLKKGGVYFFVPFGRRLNIIHKHKKTEGDKMWCECVVFDDRDYLIGGCVRFSDIATAYEATQNQIALLNSYISGQ